jgi:hypothetical protein
MTARYISKQLDSCVRIPSDYLSSPCQICFPNAYASNLLPVVSNHPLLSSAQLAHSQPVWVATRRSLLRTQHSWWWSSGRSILRHWRTSRACFIGCVMPSLCWVDLARTLWRGVLGRRSRVWVVLRRWVGMKSVWVFSGPSLISVSVSGIKASSISSA